jgi:hypothetical protein
MKINTKIDNILNRSVDGSVLYKILKWVNFDVFDLEERKSSKLFY